MFDGQDYVKHFMKQQSVSKMSARKLHGSIFLWLITLLFRSSPLEEIGFLQIYNNITGEHPCRSCYAVLNKIPYWQTIYMHACLCYIHYILHRCIFRGLLLIFVI